MWQLQDAVILQTNFNHICVVNHIFLYSKFYVFHPLLIIIIISSSSSSSSIWPLGRFWQEPEPSQATGMVLARCTLGKFLRVVCHCFPLPLDVPTFAARYLHIRINASAPSSERWNCSHEMVR
jgi:hypothetical protein